MNKKSRIYIFSTVLVLSLVSMVVSLILSVETLNVANEAATSCSVTEWLDCGSVIKTSQSELFGFPNSFLGIAGFTALVTIAVGVLMNSHFSRLFMAGVQAFVTGGFVFAEWMFEQSVFVIQILCPYCLVVSFSMTIIFFAVTRYNLLENNLYLSEKIHKTILNWLEKDYDKTLAVVWIGLMIGVIIARFPVL